MHQLIYTIRQSKEGHISIFEDGGLIFHAMSVKPLDNKAMRRYLADALKFVECAEENKLYEKH